MRSEVLELWGGVGVSLSLACTELWVQFPPTPPKKTIYS
jgi:hypothetical protein